MTGITHRDKLTLPYTRTGSESTASVFDDLTVWSEKFGFRSKESGVLYPSVDHYLFARLLRDKHNPSLLSIRNNDALLRQKFNDLANLDFIQMTSSSIQEGVLRQTENNVSLGGDPILTYLTQNRNKYFYYISDNTLWGINSQGFGYNLLGQSYSRHLVPTNSSVYRMNSSSVYGIYKASVLLRLALQDGRDISRFIGVSVRDVETALSPLFGESVLASEQTVFQMYRKDPLFENIQWEIDYPYNLAGFVRQTYIRQINHYLRNKFSKIMVHHYFEWILRTKYGHVLKSDRGDAIVDFLVRQQIGRLSLSSYQRLSDRLFEIYNDPDTKHKCRPFLTEAVMRDLYDIEMSFLSSTEIESQSLYVPFLFHVKTNQSLYIYDDNIPTSNKIQPFSDFLSPLHQELGFKGFINLAHFVYASLLDRFTHLDLEESSSLLSQDFRYRLDALEFRVKEVFQAYKRVLLKTATQLKFQQNPMARYVLNKTRLYPTKTIIFRDPDPVIQENLVPLLIELRDSRVTGSLYDILLKVPSNDVSIQDRVRFRLEDFRTVFRSYTSFLKKGTLSANDFDKLEEDVYKDPRTFFTSPAPDIIAYIEPLKSYLTHANGKRLCDDGTVVKVASFIRQYTTTLTTHQKELDSQKDRVGGADILSPDPSGTVTRHTLGVLAHLVKTFYKRGGDELAFCKFALRLLLGNDRKTFVPSVTYYSSAMEETMRFYLPIDDYDSLFIVNLFGVCGIARKQMTMNRYKYMTYIAEPSRDEPYASSLGSKVNKHVYTDIVMPEPKKKGKKTIKDMKKMLKKTKDQEGEGDEAESDVSDSESDTEEEELKDLLEELGLGDSDVESGDDSSDSSDSEGGGGYGSE